MIPTTTPLPRILPPIIPHDSSSEESASSASSSKNMELRVLDFFRGRSSSSSSSSEESLAEAVRLWLGAGEGILLVKLVLKKSSWMQRKCKPAKQEPSSFGRGVFVCGVCAGRAVR